MASVPAAATSEVRLSFESARASGPAPRRSSRRAWLLVGGAATVAVIGLFIALGRDDAPPEPGEAVDVNVERFPEVTEAPPRTSPQATPPPLLADAPPVGSRTLDPTARLVLAAAPREFVIDIAPELAGINPTEVIALQGDVGLYEVSLPSGRVRVTDLGFSTGQTQLVATDQAAAIWPTPEGGAQIVTTQRSVGIVEAQVDRVSWSPGTDRMYLWAGRPSLTGEAPAVIAVDGAAPEIRLSPADWVDDVDDPAVLLDFDGGLLRRDTGGTYKVGPDGAERLTTGYVIANGPNHLLLRECDAERSCGLVSVGRDGTRRDWPIDVPDGVSQQQLAGLSPGGDALLVIGDRMSADVPGTLQILELTDGAVQPLQASQIFEGFASWDSNGAGIFYADRQLLYFDRFTGESVVVSDDLPRLRAVRTRRPADSPFCEVLEAALPRFDKMAAGGLDNMVSAPAADVLDRVVAFAPDSLQVEASAVARFVNEFVSPDVADSQTVEFWPAQATNGLDALATYAAAECRFANR